MHVYAGLKLNLLVILRVPAKPRRFWKASCQVQVASYQLPVAGYQLPGLNGECPVVINLQLI